MKTKEIRSHSELKAELSLTGRSYLLLYKSGSDQSDCAYRNLTQTPGETEELSVLTADINSVRDIHNIYGIKSVPSLLEFDKGEYRNVYKGCHNPDVLKAIFEDAVYFAVAAKEGKTIKQVTVYSTPTCSWCNTLKSFLNKNKIRYTDVDISRDQSAGQQLVARTGQQGVPQTEINGQWVVGFDQQRLKTLLEI